MDAIILFGSRARGDSTEYSDYDVLVFDESTDGSFLNRLRFVRQFIPDGNIDLHLYSPKLSPLLAYQILKDARILYEASPEIGALKLAEIAIHAEKGDVPFKYIREVKKMGKMVKVVKALYSNYPLTLPIANQNALS
jgi:predicted nucleotidyltransferase